MRSKSFLKSYAIALSTIVTIYLLFSLTVATNQNDVNSQFEEITVKRINVVDENGNNVMILSNASRFPAPRINGEEVNGRSINPAGIVFYNKKGDECGGLGIIDMPEINMTKLIFDYSNSEAIGIGMWETKNRGIYGAGLSIAEPMPLDSDPIKDGTSGPERLTLSTENKNVFLQLNAPDGEPRIRMMVDSLGKPSFLVFDENGNPKEIMGNY